MGLLGSVEFLSMACGVVRTKLIAIFIGTAGVGLLGLYSNAMELLSTLVQLGLRTTAVRDLSSAPAGSKLGLLAIIRRYNALLAVAGVLLTLLLAPLLSFITFGDTSRTWAFLALSIMVGASTIVAGRGAELQAERRLRALARASLWATVISLLLAAPMIIWWGISAIVPLLLTYSVVACVAYLVATRRSGRLPTVDPAEFRVRVKSMARLGFFLTVSGCASWLAGYTVLSVLNHIGGSEAMGLYQAGYTLTVRYVGVVFTALSLEYFPRLATSLTAGRHRGQVMLRHETLLSVAVVVALVSIMIMLAPRIVMVLYSDDFIGVVPMILLGAPGVVMRAVSWSMAYVIVAGGRGKLFMLTELSGCAICIVSMVAGFKLAGMAGVGIGFTVWYSLYTFIIWCATRRALHVTLGARVWRLCWAAFIFVAVLSAAFYLRLRA